MTLSEHEQRAFAQIEEQSRDDGPGQRTHSGGAGIATVDALDEASRSTALRGIRPALPASASALPLVGGFAYVAPGF